KILCTIRVCDSYFLSFCSRMALEDDDWDLSAEELNSLERDAVQKLAQQRINSASACSSSSFSSSHNHHQLHQSFPSTINNSNTNCFQSSPAKPIPNSLPNKVAPLSPGTRVSPSLVPCKVNLEDERLKELPKLSVKFFLHASGKIAAKFPYDQVLVGAFRKIPKSTWNAEERLWMFPTSSLSPAEKIIHETSGVNVEMLDGHENTLQVSTSQPPFQPASPREAALQSRKPSTLTLSVARARKTLKISPSSKTLGTE
ncbi:unnamed protein product, partial [Prunus brigantina]